MKAERLLRGKDAALDDENMEILLDAIFGRSDFGETPQRSSYRIGYRLGLVAGAEQLLQRIGHLKVVDEGDTLLTEFVRQHPSMVEDLRIAADKLDKARPILAGALEGYADELCKFDGGQSNG